jgi:uncharacterized protein YoaH (UPF0181 family)
MIRETQQRQAQCERLDDLLSEGFDSGPATPSTREDWDRIRREGMELIAQRKR